MNQTVDRDSAVGPEAELTSEQFAVIRELVGDEIAREDLPALETAYRDFRTGMHELKSAFEQLTHAGVKP